ncbi:unnamed protein product [Musa hybrid cultivar]
MAAAEARAAWQRTANRYLVQEDAKRAPKLACCSSSTPQSDSSNGNTASAQDSPGPNFMPFSRNLTNAYLSPETKWWLQLQPNFGYQNELICEQLSSLEDEADENMETAVPKSKLGGESLPVDFVLKKEVCFMESSWVVSTAFEKHGSETRIKEMKTTTSYSQQLLKPKTSMVNYLDKKDGLLDLKPVDQFTSRRPEKASSYFETSWAGGNNSEPWWRIADKDELALLVAQKSLHHIENCDLPKPSQTVHVTRDPLSAPENSDTSGIFQSSLGRKLNADICNGNKYSCNTSTSVKSDNKNLSSSERGYMLHDSEKPYRQGSIYDSGGYVKNEQPERNQTCEDDLSRAQLLEALCHSQTRARKAEMAAQKAYDEKEHIVKLLLRQASHLFAYKQWLLMLQLENLFLQLRIKEHQISTVIPVVPWIAPKGKLSSEGKITRRRRKKHKCEICKYAVALSLGLGLAGMGLLFGWTIGWLFPPAL